MIIKNADIHTMTDCPNFIGAIRIENGIIREIEKSIDAKKDEEVIDLYGMHIYPGFVDAHTHVGIMEDSLGFEGEDLNEDSDPITPHLRAIDAVNPTDKCFKEALSAGITTVLISPGSANPIAGQLMAVNTLGFRIDDMVIKSPIGIKFSLGENPKSTYSEKSQSPITRMATCALIREYLFKAQIYLEKKETSILNNDELPEYDIKLEALIPLLKREIPAYFHVHRTDDIFTAIRISNEFHIKYILIHATEGHLICDSLKQENACVLSGPSLIGRTKPELLNLTPSSAAIMNNQGIDTAIITDHPEIPIQFLPLCAAIACRAGMNELDALKSITITPAKICGINDKVGSIEVGKRADFSVFKNSPLLASEKPKMVFCGGTKVEL